MTPEAPNAMAEYVPGRIWLKDYPIRFAGCRFNARMTVIRLSDGRLLIHSPSPIDAVTKTEIEGLGLVAFIIAPGNYHYLHVKSAQDAFVGAERGGVCSVYLHVRHRLERCLGMGPYPHPNTCRWL